MKATALFAGLTQREKNLVTSVFVLKIEQCLSMDFLQSSAVFEIASHESETSEEDLFRTLAALGEQTASAASHEVRSKGNVINEKLGGLTLHLFKMTSRNAVATFTK